LGDNEASRFVLSTLREEGVDMRHVVRQARANPVRSIVVVNEKDHGRTILYDANQVVGAAPNRPAKGVILSSRVLLVDRFGTEGMVRAARIARSAGIPVVGDFESINARCVPELVGLTDHLIVSEGFALRLTDATAASEAVVRLMRSDRAVAVVTCGAKGGWYWSRDADTVRRFAAFRVKTVDTTGCGDVFHGAYAAALAKGLPLAERLRIASAAAAVKSTGRGGQGAIPTWAQLQRMLVSAHK
jgi:sugar/nucleoside kinase (ribokinase family)